MAPQLLHTDFDTELDFTAQYPFSIRVVSPLVAVRVVRDARVEAAGPAQEQQAVRRARKKEHLSLLRVSLWLTVLGFVLLIVGVSLSYVDEALGAQFRIPSILILPVALPLLVISGIRTLAASVNAQNPPRRMHRRA